MRIESRGLYGDTKSGGGLFRGHRIPNTSTDAADNNKPGAPADFITHREVGGQFWDFITQDDVDSWTVTNITSGTATILDESINGALRLTATTANQGLGSVQFTGDAGAFLTPAAARVICCEARVTINDVSDCDWFWGIAEVDTTVMSNAGALLANGGDNHVGFHHLIADAGVPAMSSAGVAVANVERTLLNAGSDASKTMSDATAHRLGFRILGTSTVEFYFDDTLVHQRAMANALAEQVTPTLTMIANGSAITMDVDYILVSQTR